MEDYLVVIVFLCLLVPMIFLLGILKGRSRTVFGYMMVGMTIGLLASQINTMIYMAVPDQYYVVTNLTPISEEVLKALPVLFFTFAVSRKADYILPVAAAVGIGFAVFENTTLLLQSGTLDIAWILCRGIGAGLMHAICTAAVGMGMSIVSYRKRLFLPGTFSLLSLAIIYHGVFNTLVESEHLKYVGILIPIITYIPLLILLKRREQKLSQEDKEEQ